MHVLHRSNLGSAVVVTAIAAVLTIVITLAIASGLSDHAPAPARLTAPTRALATVTRPGPSKTPFTRSPFSGLLTAPVKQPWAQNIR